MRQPAHDKVSWTGRLCLTGWARAWRLRVPEIGQRALARGDRYRLALLDESTASHPSRRDLNLVGLACWQWLRCKDAVFTSQRRGGAIDPALAPSGSRTSMVAVVAGAGLLNPDCCAPSPGIPVTAPLSNQVGAVATGGG